MESLWPRVEPLLAQVTKPARYIGGELGAQRVEHDPRSVSWLLTYPDTYEIGLPNQGLQILYEILNERHDAVAERTYAPWVDMEAAMRSAGVPLFSLENHLPARCFDVFAFNLSAELVYTNVLNLIDLAGIPVHGAERTADDPVVVAGGHCAFNPEPLADFVDCFVLGDGEEAIGEINQVIAAAKARRIDAGPSEDPSVAGRRFSVPWPVFPGSTYRPVTRPTTSRCRRPAGPRAPPPPHWSPPPPATRRPPPGWRSGPSPTWASGPTPGNSWCRSSRSSTTGSTSSCSGAVPAAAGSVRRG